MTDSHLDDEQLSLLLDGVAVDDRAHVEGQFACPSCAGRLAALRAARDAVASAAVRPLSAEALDRIVRVALDDAAAEADVVALAPARRRRRMTTPPPAWLIGAAAGIAVLVGVAGVLRVADTPTGGGDAGLAATAADEESTTADVDTGGQALPAAGTATAGGSAEVDPEVVLGDLADVDDAGELALALDGLTLTPAADAQSTTPAFAARESATGGGASGGTTAAPSADSAKNDQSAAASPAPPATTIAVERAQCRARADAIGAGRFAALLSTATLRWRGTPAEVLVFRLAEPSAPDAPETRQALVLSRPGCELLADPRF